MNVVHICGSSGVGKNFLLSKIRLIENKQNDVLSDSETSLLRRFEIQTPFKVLNPVSKNPKWETPTVEVLKDNAKAAIEAGEYETVVEHWQSKGHSIIDYIHDLRPETSQKAFLIWKDPELHLYHLKTKRPNSDHTKRSTIESLKAEFTKLYHRVVNTPNLEVEVIVHVIGHSYYSLSEDELKPLV